MDSLYIVSLSFHTAGKIFDFDAADFDLLPGDQVIVETERGRALGTIISKPREITPEKAPPKLKAILRRATENDLQMAQSNSEREQEALQFCRQRVKHRKMVMKLVRAEYLFDGSKIIFFFTADGRVDFRELVRDLAQHFRTRIEMRQIGVRDEAKQVGGLGICGRELCCSNHLREFVPVSVKMAKAQGLALNPSKISGQCGRLLCCLAYEYETYNEMKKGLPKCGKKLRVQSGIVEVIARDILAQKITLSSPNGDRYQIHFDELQKEIDTAAKTPSEPSTKQVSQVKKPKLSRVEQSKKRHGENKLQPNDQTNQKKESPNLGQSGDKEESRESSGKEKSKRRRRRPRRRSNRQTKPTESKS